MIETLYATDALDTPAGFLIAGVIGIFFGVALERAGLASSRKIAATFYFRDMTVVKVMFTAMVVAAAGLACLFELGWLRPDSLNLLDTVYGAHVVGGLLLGVGMVVGGWCPGTALAGLGSGRLDALLFLIGAVGGSVLFNEIFPWVKPLYNYEAAGIVSAPDLLNVSGPAFVVGLSVVAVVMFWVSEAVERARQLRIHQTPDYLDYLSGRPVPESLGAGMPGRTLVQTGYYRVSVLFLVVFSVFLLALAGGLLFVEPVEFPQLGAGGLSVGNWQFFGWKDHEDLILGRMELGLDHIEPAELAERVMSGEPDLIVVDIRPREEFQDFHIRGAVNVPPSQLADYLEPYKNRGVVVLYSNGMTHPAQAADSLRRRGHDNVFILTDGLDGFIEECLKPASLRPYPVSAEQAERIRACRAYFLAGEAAPPIER